MLTRRPFRTFRRRASLRRFAAEEKQKQLSKDYKQVVLTDVKTLHDILTNGLSTVKGLSDWATEYELPFGKLLEKIETSLKAEAEEVAQAFKALNTQPTTARTRLAMMRYASTQRSSSKWDLPRGRYTRKEQRELDLAWELGADRAQNDLSSGYVVKDSVSLHPDDRLEFENRTQREMAYEEDYEAYAAGYSSVADKAYDRG